MISDRAAAAALRQALAAVDLGYAEPLRARRLALTALAAAGDHPEPRSVAERALGMAAVARGELAEAEPHLRGAIGVAETAGLAGRAAEARGSIAYLLSLTGRSNDALAEIDRAAEVLTGLPAARLEMSRALVLAEAGHFDQAATGYRRALGTLAAAGGDPLLEADIRNNRSLVHVQRRDWRAAAEDLSRAEALYDAISQPGRTATVYHNRALAEVVRGDLPAALRAFDIAADRYAAAGRDPGLLAIDRAEALLSVLLIAEARTAAESAVAQFTARRNAVDLVQARLLLARTALLAADPATARVEADRAGRSAARQHRPGWTALAGYLALLAGGQTGQPAASTIRAGRRAAGALARAGWAVEALDTRLIVARAAIDSGRLDVARRELAGIRRIHRHDPAQLRARMWHARALLRLSEGDRAGALAALRSGIRLLDEFRASLGATELQVHAAGHAGQLAGLGLRLAVDAGNANSALAWAERWRAGALLLRPARPVPDPALAGDLAQLRQVVAEVGAVAARGGDTGALLRRQAGLEEAVRRRSRRAGAGPTGRGAGAVSGAQLRAALGAAVLLEYLAVDDELYAVVLAGGRPARLQRLGSVRDVELQIGALRHGLRRMLSPISSGASLAAAGQLVQLNARRLDALLLQPLLEPAAGRPLVVVPTGALHALPWSALPSCAGRPVSIAPSAALWHRSVRADGPTDPGRDGGYLFAAGPGLPHASAEVIELARRQPGSSRFTGRRATAERVAAAMNGARLAHLAAHGQFRADNPLFSALRLADGPLMVHDVERLTRPPQLVVLSACESGLPAVHPGDELVGLAAALLALGVRSLIATTIPVPDRESRDLMLSLHRRLRAGMAPAAALAAAGRELADDGPAAAVAAAGYVCFGAG